jgi:hypothetical protein
MKNGKSCYSLPKNWEPTDLIRLLWDEENFKVKDIWDHEEGKLHGCFWIDYDQETAVIFHEGKGIFFDVATYRKFLEFQGITKFAFHQEKNSRDLWLRSMDCYLTHEESIFKADENDDE